MGILRADLLTHSQLEGSGSVEFDGVGDYLTFGSHSAFSPATADVTIELWVYLTDSTNLSSGNYYLCDMGANGYRFQIYNGGLYWAVDPNDYVGPINNVLSNNTWHHIAGVRNNNSLELYVDGVHLGTKITTASVTSTTFTIGSYSTGGGDYEPYGYISNFRYVRGVVYKNNFTPPKFELKNIPGTIVLGCQSTTSATDFAVTPSTVTANGDAAASAFHPGLKKDITDTGVVFDGFGTFATSTYMVPPSGKTTERNRGRGLIMGGGTPSGASTGIESIEVQSSGNGVDFGSLSATTRYNGGAASATRGLSIGGKSPSVNTIEFVTIANSSNSTDFGDLTQDRRYPSPVSNDTRAVIMGGYAEAPVGYNNIIDFVTIATAGNATDFGDTTNTVTNGAPVNSTTRGLMCGGQGNDPYARENVIQFITIASTGNAQDFGDLTLERRGMSSVSSSTRGIISGGAASPAATNIMDYVTIASAGDAIDFGDSTVAVAFKPTGQICSRTRGVFVAGGYPSQGNVIDFVTIATTGNASDFGDLLVSITDTAGACSDSHGGLS